jgi:hypothetical protein
VRFLSILSQFSEDFKTAIKKGAQIRVIFEGDTPDNLLEERVQKLIDGAYVHVRFYRKPLNHFIMSDNREAMITASKESGLGEAPTLWTNNGNLIGILKTSFELEWQKAKD